MRGSRAREQAGKEEEKDAGDQEQTAFASNTRQRSASSVSSISGASSRGSTHRSSITDTIRRTKKRFSRPHLVQNPTAAAEQLDWLLRFKDPALERQFEEAWAEDYCQFSSQWWFGFVLVQLIVVVRVTSKAEPGEWVGNELWSFLTAFLLVSFHFYSTWFRSHLVVVSASQQSWPGSVLTCTSLRYTPGLLRSLVLDQLDFCPDHIPLSTVLSLPGVLLQRGAESLRLEP